MLAIATAMTAVGDLKFAAPLASAAHDPKARATADLHIPHPRDGHDAREGPDSVIVGGVDAFHRGMPALDNLDADLLRALRRAARAAERDAVAIRINSGWRSLQHQQRLLDDAVTKYGSQEEAARWVATAKTSSHVSGDAVDIGPADAMAWLSEHGANYGLCQIYRNEPWHFELRSGAAKDGCPQMYADPTHDPRMRP